jgi:hypothetical protein
MQQSKYIITFLISSIPSSKPHYKHAQYPMCISPYPETPDQNAKPHPYNIVTTSHHTTNFPLRQTPPSLLRHLPTNIPPPPRHPRHR